MNLLHLIQMLLDDLFLKVAFICHANSLMIVAVRVDNYATIMSMI